MTLLSTWIFTGSGSDRQRRELTFPVMTDDVTPSRHRNLPKIHRRSQKLPLSPFKWRRNTGEFG